MRLSAILVACAAAALLAPAASAAPPIRYGIHDDAWIVHGPGALDERLDRLQRLGVDVVRFTLRWDEIAPARPENARSPLDAGYRWGAADAVLRGLRERRIGAVVGIVGSPRWANGGRTPNFAPRARDMADFASAAASRYPWVRDWLVWNEPNQRRWLRPTSPRVYVRSILNPAYAAIHAVIPRARVAGGVTAPRAATGGVSPVDWIRGMRRARAKLDVYAHHPYPLRPSDTPAKGGCAGSWCKTITMAQLERLISEVTRAWGKRKRIWLTEYGYQTGWLGVSARTQARYVAEAAHRAFKAPRVDMLVHYLVVDEPDPARWQSGLFTVHGKAKPAMWAFELPFVQAARTVFWGQVRPNTGRQRYRVQVSTGRGWRWLGPLRRTSPRGFFTVRATVPKGARLRVWSPNASYSLPIVVR